MGNVFKKRLKIRNYSLNVLVITKIVRIFVV